MSGCYSMLIRWSDEDQTFIATLPEFDNAMTDGPTYETAARQGRLLIESFVLWYEQDGRPLPRPNLFEGCEQNVKVSSHKSRMMNAS
jgi:predicted RNase H-like HicB family nuclease